MSSSVRVSSKQIDAVWAALQPYRGQDQAVARDDLRVRCGLSDRILRAVIHELVVTHHRPIGSLPTGGYFVIVDAEEAATVARVLRSYAMELLDRARAVQRAFEAEGQVALFP